VDEEEKDAVALNGSDGGGEGRKKRRWRREL